VCESGVRKSLKDGKTEIAYQEISGPNGTRNLGALPMRSLNRTDTADRSQDVN
jgi:hypothetical protein